MPIMRQRRFLLWVSRHPMLQLVLMLAFWPAGEALVRALSLPLPGALVGLAAAARTRFPIHPQEQRCFFGTRLIL